jgi:phthalate 4,5-dioxygenase reductase subunit
MIHPSFTTLKVSRAERIAAGIHLFELRHPQGDELPEFTAGSHLTVRVPNSALRKYSLCNDPQERDRYVIAVKREATGRGGSVSMIDQTKSGDLLSVSARENTFELAERATSFIFIAGGIGITPIMAMIRHVKSSGRGRFKLYYCTRSAEETAFVEDLSLPEFRGQVVIHHDGGDPARALDLWPVLEKPSRAHIYCCGPRPLMQVVRDMTGHWSKSAIHFESFVDAGAGARPEDRPFMVRLAKSGQTVEVPVGVSIMDALRSCGHEVPSSCESGTCGTCKTGLLAGEVDHRDLVLAEHEQASHIMVCVSRARSEEIVIDR